MNDAYSTPEITGAYKTYEDTANKAIEYNSAASLLPEKLKQAVNEKLDYNRDLIEKKNQLAAQYFQAPSEARAKYADPTSANYIFNPFQAENLVSQYRQNAWEPYQTASDILAARTGSIAEGINAAANAFKGEAGVMTDRASLARQKWADLFDVAKQRVSDKGSGGGMGSILDTLPNGSETPETWAPTEPQPTIDMTQADRNINWHSPDGQWQWNWQYMAWVPSGADVVE